MRLYNIELVQFHLGTKPIPAQTRLGVCSWVNFDKQRFVRQRFHGLGDSGSIHTGRSDQMQDLDDGDGAVSAWRSP